LVSVAPSVWHSQARRADPRAPGADRAALTELELARAAQKAVALAQQEKSAWTRADVIKYLGRVLPRTGRNPGQAAALLEDLADRARRAAGGPGRGRAGRPGRWPARVGDQRAGRVGQPWLRRFRPSSSTTSTAARPKAPSGSG